MAVCVEKTKQKQNPRLMQLNVTSTAEDMTVLERRGYTLDGKTLGEGSYGKVKLATRQGQDHDRVAVKIVNLRKAPTTFKLKFLPRELDLLKQIQHPNIVRLHEVIIVGAKIYLIMEFAGHGDLLEYIKLRGQLDEHKSRTFFTDVVDAVCYLHSINVVHRDLKCENLLLDSRNKIKVTDFGFARHMKPGDVSRTYCGSAAYAAPEILRGRAYSGVKNDIWSLGVILYIMVTGQMPYDDTNLRKLLREQEKKIKFPDKCAELSHEVQTLIWSLLEFDVRARADIDDILNSEWMKETRAQIETQDRHTQAPPSVPTRTISVTDNIESQHRKHTEQTEEHCEHQHIGKEQSHTECEHSDAKQTQVLTEHQ